MRHLPYNHAILVGYVLLLMMLVGCSQQASSLKGQQNEKEIATEQVIPNVQPLTIHQYRTTNGDIYLGNLNSRIQSLTQLANNTATHRLLLASSLYHRYQIIGKFDDLTEAQVQLSTYLQQIDHNSQQSDAGFILQASIYSATHQFDQALATLKKLTRKASQPAQISKAEIQFAQGLYEKAKTTINSLAANSEPAIDSQVLSLQANLAIEQGNLAQGLRLFDQAQQQYTNTNPVTLAWLQTQMGIALLRNQKIAQARTFFLSAQQRLPTYSLATEHLAESELTLGNLLSAEKLYASVSQQTKNPEFYAMLAKTQKKLGKNSAAAQSLRTAEQGYSDLLREQPQAFSQHAAQFFYDTGKLPQALELAELNLQNREDIHSWLLLSHISKAMHQQIKACDALAKANSLNMHPPELKAANNTSDCEHAFSD
ncbi:MAG: hypothetical protein V3V18_06990 [Methylococcales bacterium]